MKDKIAVIYKSKYGTTKRYAGWIALKLQADLYEVSDIRDKDLKEYDTIIYGGPLYLGKIKGINFIKKNYEKIKNKNVILFIVGMISFNEGYIDSILKKNFDDVMIKTIKTFYLRGDINYSELNNIDKILMKGLKKSILSKDKKELTEDDEVILKSFSKPMKFCDKKSINNIMNFINITKTEI